MEAACAILGGLGLLVTAVMATCATTPPRHTRTGASSHSSPSAIEESARLLSGAEAPPCSVEISLPDLNAEVPHGGDVHNTRAAGAVQRTMVASASASGAFSPLFGEAEAHAEAEASEMAAAFDGMGVADVGAVGESGTVAWEAAGGGAPAL